MANQRIDCEVKVVLLGDFEVGKSHILARCAGKEINSESQTTTDFDLRTLVIKDRSVRAHIWHTVGQERFDSITSSYYKDADGVMLVYDITNRQSFDHIPDWLKALRDHAEKDPVIILIGNKSDLDKQRAVIQGEAEKFAQEKGLLFSETSALKEATVETAFHILLEEIVNRNNPVAASPPADVNRRLASRNIDSNNNSNNINGSNNTDNYNTNSKNDSSFKICSIL